MFILTQGRRERRGVSFKVTGASGNQLPSHRRGGVSVARGGVSNFNTPPVSTPRPPCQDPAP